MDKRPIGISIAALFLCVFSSVLSGQQTTAKDRQVLLIIASNPLRGALEKILPDYERASDQRLVILFGTSADLKRRIENGATFDLTILTPALIDDLMKDGKIAAGTHTDIARSDLAVGMRAGAPRSDISTADAIKRRLLAAKSITYAREGAATPAFVAMFSRLGIADTLKPKTVLQTVPRRPAESVAEGQNELVLAPASELNVPRVEVLGFLPKEFQNPIVMTAGISAQSKRPNAAKALVAFLTSPDAASAIKSSGMEPAARK